MCNFCELEPNWEYPENHVFAIDDDIDFKFSSKIESATADLDIEATAFLNLLVDINGKGEFYISLGTEEFDKIIYEKKLNFNFCPMCGKELIKKHV